MFSAATAAGALPPSLSILLHAPCSSCRTNHCRGCFSPLECPPSCKGPSKNAKCIVESCCSGVRALAIFECLGGLDRQFLGERATSKSRALALAQQQTSKSGSVGPGGAKIYIRKLNILTIGQARDMEPIVEVVQAVTGATETEVEGEVTVGVGAGAAATKTLRNLPGWLN